jgi:hypothetical protein
MKINQNCWFGDGLDRPACAADGSAADPDRFTSAALQT